MGPVYEPLGYDEVEVRSLARAVQTELWVGTGVIVRCWNKAEAMAVRALVGEDPRVQVTWLEFR